jgi:cytochrome oxidase assembly protein ShyY1
MGSAEVFQALGGGLAGLLGAAVVALFGMLLWQLNARLKERDARIAELKDDLKEKTQLLKDQTAANNRLADVVEAWTPQVQRRGRGAAR